VNTPPSLGGAIAGLGLFCAVSLLFLGFSIQKASDVLTELELLREGEINEGVILNRHEESSPEKSFWLEYQFWPRPNNNSSPTLHRNQAAVDWNTYASSRPRSNVLIRYLPTSPETNRLDQQQPLLGNLAGLAIRATLVISSTGTLFSSVRSLHDSILLACRGRQVMAQVVDRWTEVCGEGTRSCVSYRFTTYPSPPFIHYMAEDNYRAYHKLSVHDQVMVRFVPDRPWISRLKL
jgi:hypothetical protein